MLLRDIAVAAVHSSLLAIYGKAGCDGGSNSSVVLWLIVDVFLCGIRIAKNLLHFIAIRKVRQADDTEHGDMNGVIASQFYTSIMCGMRTFTLLDWLVYFAWVCGIWTVRMDECQNADNPLQTITYWELTAASICYFAFLALYSIVFILNRSTRGFCFPGFSIDNSHWPDACPALTVDRTAWRRTAEPVAQYRERRWRHFNTLVVNEQPIAMAAMTQSSVLTIEELARLRSFVYSKQSAYVDTEPPVSAPTDDRMHSMTVTSIATLCANEPNESNDTTSSCSNRHTSTLPTSSVTCALCLDEYKDGDLLRELGCSHLFHADCVDEWLLTGKSKCPICNRHALGQD